MPNVYLPPKKRIDWNDTSKMSDPKDFTEYPDPNGKMDVLNADTVSDSIYPEASGAEEYHHKDGSERHPETLYLIPGNPRHRSDSLAR